MKKVIQSHSFPVENKNIAGTVLAVGAVLALGSSNVFAEDPAWFTALNTQLTWIGTSVVSVLGVIVGIRLTPLAWTHIKRVIHR